MIALVRIPEQSFQMGSLDGGDDERPVHRVVVSAFDLGIYQVTNAEWSAFRAADGDPQRPFTSVSWFDAVAFCQWMSAQTGRQFRLPTEAEWECAARGGVEGTRYPWGSEAPADQGRWTNGPARAGLGLPNGFGLNDMCTNVHEWCSDWYSADYYSVSPARDPHGPGEGTRRASRGGSWRHHVKVTRCAARSSIPPEFRYADYGFRVACDVR